MHIAIADDPEAIGICMDLRRIVFIDEQDVPEADERDGKDGDCTHVLARFDGEPVGAARINWATPGVAKIQRVCVVSPSRGLGIGAAIIRFIVEYVGEGKRAQTIRLGSQVHAIGFYRKLGFAEVGEEYLEAGIRHRDMLLSL